MHARCSVLYDVLNKYVLDGTLGALKQGERDLAISHLEHCKDNDLILYDRGYPSYDLIHQHIERGLEYLMRVKTKFRLTIAFEKSNKKSLIVEIYPGGKVKFTHKQYTKNSLIKVRLIRVALAGGQVEILMTSLLNSKAYPTSQFKQLYFKRWGC